MQQTTIKEMNPFMKPHHVISAAGIPAVPFCLFSSSVLAGKEDAADAPAPYHPTIDPANFSEVVNNPYFTLTPGTTYTYQKQDGEKTEITKVTVNAYT